MEPEVPLEEGRRAERIAEAWAKERAKLMEIAERLQTFPSAVLGGTYHYKAVAIDKSNNQATRFEFDIPVGPNVFERIEEELSKRLGETIKRVEKGVYAGEKYVCVVG